MNYKDYLESVKDIPISEKLRFYQAVLWLHPSVLPLGLLSLGETEQRIVKVPAEVVNRYGNTVPVISLARDTFRKNETVTDIILPSSIRSFPQGAFYGCTNLRNITIPKTIKEIQLDTFGSCENLQNIYYEGTWEEWQKIRIPRERHEVDLGEPIGGAPVQKVVDERLVHVPGNDEVLAATVHFQCKFANDTYETFGLPADGKDDTDIIRAERQKEKGI